MPENDELRAAMLAGELSVAACLAAARGEHKEWQFKDELLRETIECIRDLYESNEQHEASFDLRWKADQRAIKRWQEAHPGKKNVWPDHADLCVWLMEQLARPPLTRERVTESQLSLLNDVAGLCHSEANRWERASPKTSEHWRKAAVELQASYLAAHAMLADGLTRERVEKAVGELCDSGDVKPFSHTYLTDRLCRLLGVEE